MTDDPTKNPPDEPSQPASQPTPPPPPAQPSEPSGAGFAAIRLPGQQTPSQPLPGQTPAYADAYQPPAAGAPTPPPAPQPTPMAPPPGPMAPPPEPIYNSYNPPPPPTGPVYQFDYSRTPPNRGGVPVLALGAIAFLVVLIAGVGGMLALGIGPFARVTPAPTVVAQPTPTARPVTPAPTTTSAATQATTAPSPSGSAGTTATPIASGDIKAALLSHIPAPIRDSCFVSVPGGDSTILALATCSADDGNIALTYFQYADHDAMYLPYNGFRLASQIEPDTGDCNDHDSWPAEAPFNIGGVEAGRWLCTEALGATSIYWTDDRLNIMSQATQTVPDYQRLLDFWFHESGPDL